MALQLASGQPGKRSCLQKLTRQEAGATETDESDGISAFAQKLGQAEMADKIWQKI